jgi:hypothetical protein
MDLKKVNWKGSKSIKRNVLKRQNIGNWSYVTEGRIRIYLKHPKGIEFYLN